MEGRMTEMFDAIVIGAGQSGPYLAVRMAQKGMKVALIERTHLGGTCVNNGCIPTKTMVASAKAAHVARRAADYGVVLDGSVSVDMKVVKARKDKIVGASIKSLTDWIGSTENLTLVWGSARFTRARTVRVGDRELTAPKIFINTGGRPIVPDWSGLADIPYLTNVTMMDLDVLPEHLIVVGGSYIGLEFAQMFRRFGSRVTVIEHGPRLVGREDEEVSETIREILAGEGIEIHCGASDIAVEKQGSGLRLTAKAQDGAVDIAGSHLLLAIGRLPNVEDLDLPAAGVAQSQRGYIDVDDQLRTNVEGIWAMGDVTGHGAFTHTSYNDFEVVAANLLDNDPRRVSDRIEAYALYIDPPLGRIGMTEKQVRDSGRKALVGKMPMTRVGRAKEKGETQGFMKVLVDAESKLILGAALLCTEGDEVVHSLLDVMYAKAPYTLVQRAMHIHPTVSELIPTMMGELKPLE
jgi:pyruvate/2-oxoglutarate dehydrogenase complex dihydrolipoamide dehydrogenase (E3) component